MPLKTGHRLGPYEIVAALGAGGMGEVYEARDSRLGRTVAIKVLPEALATSSERLERFEREAKAVSQLTHPHVCTLHDVGEEEGLHFLVMEHCEGETLAKRLGRGPLPLEQTLRYGAQIADALDAAHRRGVVHRDLKPSNVMLTPSGVKLLDFGLARLAEESRDDARDLATLTMSPSQPLTEEGTVLGTYPYMAPEQVEGEETDGRSDIFALGAVLYEMASGRRAFEGKSAASVMAAVLRAEPEPLSQIQPIAPPALGHIVSRCLAKEPDQRWQNAHDVAVELRWIAAAGSQAGVAAPLAKRRRSRERLAWIVTGIAALILLVGAGAWWRESEAALHRLVKLAIPIPDGANVHDLAVAPDGSAVVYALWQGDAGKLYRRRLDRLESTPIEGTEGARDPFFSPGGDWIGYFSEPDDEIRKIPAGGGSPVALATVSSFTGGSWGRDGEIVFSEAVPSGLWRVPASGGAPTAITRIDLAAPHSAKESHLTPIVLPGAHGILFTLFHPWSHSQFSVAALEKGAKRRRILFGGARPRYTPDGHLLYLSTADNVLNAVPFDLDDMKQEGNPVVIAHNVGFGIAVSPSGTLAYETAPESPARLDWIGTDGSPGPIDFPERRYGSISFSPDGHLVATDIATGLGVHVDIWIADLRRGAFTRLTSRKGFDCCPVWSPDGRWVVFASDRNGPPNLYRVPALGGAAERLTTAQASQWPNSFTPDGRHLLFSEQKVLTTNGANAGREKSDVLRLDLSSGKTEPLLHTSDTEDGATLSPDGKWLAYVSDATGSREIYLVSYPDLQHKRRVTLHGTDSLPQWSPDGRMLYYLQKGKVMAVALKTRPELRLGEPQVDRSAPDAAVFSVAPDGRILAADKTGKSERKIVVLVNWEQELKTP